MKTLHLLIAGRVQGVGYRDWLVGEALPLGLTGWVRNLGTDSVEALISGPVEAVDICIERCWHGPALAKVRNISATAAPAPNETGFVRRGSAAR